MFRNTAAQFLPPLVRTGLGVLLVAALTRYLGVRGFGQYAIVFAYVAVFSGFLGEWGLGTICLREISRPGADRVRLIGSAATLQALIALSTYLLLLGSLLVTRYPAVMVASLALYGLAILLSPLDILALSFQADLRLGRLVRPGVAGSILSFSLALAAILLHGPLLALVAAALGGLVAQYSWTTVLSLRNVAGLRPNLTGWRYYLSEAWPLGLATTAATVAQQAPLLILSLVSLEAVGLFNAAGRVPQQLILLPLMVRTSTFPLLSEAWVSNPERFRRLLASIVDASLFVSVPVALLAIGLAGPLVHILFGSSFAGAAQPFQLLMAGFAILFPAILAGEGLIVAGLQRANLMINAAVLPVLLILLAILVPRGGALGAAGALLGANICLALGAIFTVWLRLRVPGSLTSLVAGTLAAIAGAAALVLGRQLWNPSRALFAALVAAGVLGVLRWPTLRVVWRLRPFALPSSGRT